MVVVHARVHAAQGAVLRHAANLEAACVKIDFAHDADEFPALHLDATYFAYNGVDDGSSSPAQLSVRALGCDNVPAESSTWSWRARYPTAPRTSPVGCPILLS